MVLFSPGKCMLLSPEERGLPIDGAMCLHCCHTRGPPLKREEVMLSPLQSVSLSC